MSKSSANCWCNGARRSTQKPSKNGSPARGTASQCVGGESPPKAGQLRALWPEIRARIADGQSLASIRQWLEEEAGIVVVSVQSLGSYLTRIRRGERANPITSARQPLALPPSQALRRRTQACPFESTSESAGKRELRYSHHGAITQRGRAYGIILLLPRETVFEPWCHPNGAESQPTSGNSLLTESRKRPSITPKSSTRSKAARSLKSF